jgi:hypothetical protein
MFRMFACGLLIIASAPVAHAHWSKADNDKFMDDCVSSCQANPNVPVGRRGQCKAYCTCSSGLMGRVYPDYAAVNAVTTKEPQSRLVLGLTLMLACSLRVLDALRLGQPQYALVVPGNSAITFARALLELGPVDHRETTPRTTDDAVVLEQSSNSDHCRPVNPQHLSEIFLRQWKLVAANAVLRHQQPSRKTLSHRVKRITNDGLKNLREQHVCVPIEEIAHDRRALLGGLDPSRLNPKCRTSDLDHRPGECGLVTRADNPTDGAFPPNGSGFRCPAVFEDHDQRRHRSRQGKVGNDDIFVRFEENLTLGELHK